MEQGFRGTSSRLLPYLCLVLIATFARPSWSAVEGSEGAAWSTRLSEASAARGWETPGELLDLRDGSYGFEITDLVVPGTAGLDLEVVRSFDKRRLVVGEDRLFGLWDIEIPRIVTMGLPGTGAVGTGHCIYARNPIQDRVLGSNWWAGATLVVPHESPKPLLIYDKQGPLPSTADFVTTDNWTATCNGSYWTVRSPRGRTYRMDRVAIGTTGAVVYASRVSDVHGNWIAYDFTTYLDGFPQREQQLLTAIRGSAGQRITVTSERLTPGAPGSGPDQDYVISSVSHAGRTWRYAYNLCADVGSGTPVESCDREPLLTTVTRPDSRTHQYRYHKRISYAVGPGGCCQRNFFFIYRATQPNGLVAEYVVTEQDQEFFDAEPFNEKTWSLSEKRISGPGIPQYTWKFWYRVPGYQGGLNGTAWGIPIIQTYVQGPDRVHYFETERGQSDAGAPFGERSKNPANWVKGLPRTSAVVPNVDGIASPTTMQVEQHVADQKLACVSSRSSACRSEFTVHAWKALPKLGRVASDVDSSDHDFHLRSPRVPTSRVIYRDTGTYTTTWSSHTDLGYPQSLAESSSGNSTRSTALTWFHQPDNWITGLVEERKIAGEGSVYTRHNAKGLPYESGQFGLFRNYAWWSNGSLQLVSWYDGQRPIFSVQLSNYRLGIPQLEQRPEGVSTTRTVNDTGTIASETDPRGHRTSYRYDSLNRISSTTPPLGYGSTESWSGDRTLIRTRGSRRQTLEHDALGRLVRIDDRDLSTGVSIVRSFQYDSAGRRTFESDPGYGSASTAGTRYEYDALGRVVSRTHTADGATTRSEYLDGHVVRVTDPRGFRTTTTFRAFGDPANAQAIRTVQQTVLGDSSKDIVTTIARNLLGQITSVSRGGVTKTIQYNANKLPWRIYEPETGTTELTYDRAGRLTSRRVGSSPTTYFHYDDLDRLEFIDYPGTTPDVSRIYDANGNVTQLYSGLATESMSYDANDNLLSLELSIGGATIRTSYGYDALDGLASMTYPDGEVVSYAPNAFGQPTRVGSYVTQVGYRPNGDIERVYYANGIDGRQQFDTRQRPVRVYGGSSYDIAYQYDDSGNVTSVFDRYNPTHDVTLRYDGANRIDDVHFPRYSPYYTWAGDFQYDAAGNLKSKSMPRGTIKYAYDSAGRLASTSGAKSYAFTHDVYGNVIRNGSGTGFGSFTYDDAGRLRSFNIQGVQSGVHDYDGSMRRVRTILNGLMTYSLYAGNSLVFEHQLAKRILKQHYYLGDRVVATREKTGHDANTYVGGTSTVTYLHTDPRGSVVAASNSSRATLWREVYDPFGGKILKPVGGNTLWFTGREFDQGSGLAYHGARYYDPTLGRFMSPDPLSWAGGNLEQFNRYSYAANNPLGFTDKDGEILQFVLAGAVKGAIVSVATQATLISLGLQDQFSVKSVLFDAGLGAITFGAAPSAAVARASTRLTDASMLTNTVPARMSRVIPAEFASGKRLAAPTASEAWVTAAEDLAGLTTSRDLAKRLTLVDETGELITGRRAVIEFDAVTDGLASPVNRSAPGFVGRGRTAGGAREFIIPNLDLSQLENVTIRIVE